MVCKCSCVTITTVFQYSSTVTINLAVVPSLPPPPRGKRGTPGILHMQIASSCVVLRVWCPWRGDAIGVVTVLVLDAYSGCKVVNSYWLIVKLNGWLADWLNHIASPSCWHHYLCKWLGWLTDCMTEWFVHIGCLAEMDWLPDLLKKYYLRKLLIA